MATTAIVRADIGGGPGPARNNSTPVTNVDAVAALEGIISLFVRRIQNASTSATRNVRRSRRSEERPSIAAGSPEVPYIEQSPSVNAPLKETIRDQAIWRGPGRRSYQHSGLFLFADHLSHPRQDVPWEHFQGETLELSLGPTVGSRAQKWTSLRFPFLSLPSNVTPRAE